MSRIITLKNDSLTVTVSTLGAEIQSVTGNDGHEYLWCGDASAWSGRAPIMFPICGALKDNQFVHNGKQYTLTKHGFARLNEFEVIEEDDTHATFRLSSNEELKKCYPFDFHFDVSFLLSGNALLIEYRVENTGNENMYFSFGAHEAYATPEGVESYSIVFDEKQTLDTNDVGATLLYSQRRVLEDADTLPLHDGLFEQDALVLLNTPFKSVKLVNKTGAHSVRVDFDGMDNMLIWKKLGAKFVCIEPWHGTPDFSDADGILAHKAGITELSQGKQFSRRHTITFG